MCWALIQLSCSQLPALQLGRWLQQLALNPCSNLRVSVVPAGLHQENSAAGIAAGFVRPPTLELAYNAGVQALQLGKHQPALVQLKVSPLSTCCQVLQAAPWHLSQSV